MLMTAILGYWRFFFYASPGRPDFLRILSEVNRTHTQHVDSIPVKRLNFEEFVLSLNESESPMKGPILD